MSRILRPFAASRAAQQKSDTFKFTQKIILILLLTCVGALPLWLGLERAHSAPAAIPNSPALTALPDVKLEGVPAEALLGEQFKFQATFDNVGTDVGYAPFIDILLPAQGADGPNPCDGISTNVDAIMVNVNGGPLPVTTFKNLTACSNVATTVTHPFSASGVSPVLVPAGGQLLTLELPFGSFEPAQPKVTVELTVDLHSFADVGTPLTIRARGGFRFGVTPVNDNATDRPIVTDSGVPALDTGVTSDSANWAERKDVTPAVFTVSKTYLGPEGEAVSGPNFVGYYPLRYQVTVNIANLQTVNKLEIDDCLDNNMTLLGVVSPTTPGGTSSITGQCLHMAYGTVIGTGAAADIKVTYEFYIQRFIEGTKTPVLDPEICDNAISINNAEATGFWTPLDPRDVAMATQVSASAKYTLNDKRIAIQKGVKVKIVNKKGLADKGSLPIPGDYLEYRLKFQVSDFFTFGKIEIDDVISDGQLFVETAPAKPASLRVTDRFGTTQGDFTNKNLAVSESKEDCKGVKGGTRLLFNVSQAMMDLSSFVRHNQGIMTGGLSMTPNSPVPAEGEIVFYVQIQDEFSHNGDKITKFVDKEDPMNNCVTIRGQIYRNSDDKEVKPLENKDSVCSDDSGTSLMIQPDVLSKKIIARNNKPLPASATPPKFSAADTITFSISKTIPSGDWQDLTIQDWAPLPALDTSALALSGSLPSCLGVYPAANQACLGTGDDVGAPISATVNPDNSFTFDYGTQNNPNNTPKTIDIWVTLTLTNKPYADGLFFTNVAQECEFNTFGVKFCQVAVARFELNEPSLKISKGVIWAGSGKPLVKNAAAVYTPSPEAPVTVSGLITSSCASFGGTINSLKLNSIPMSSDVSNVDAFDVLVFAIVVQNRGSAANGAFDINFKDTLPAGLTWIPGSPICLTFGDHTPIGSNVGSPSLFTPAGLTLTDFSATQGALAAYDTTSASPGHDLAVVTFYVQIDKNITPSCYKNRSELTSYASAEGGPNFVPAGFGGPFTDTASACVLPLAAKCVTTTSEPHTQPDNSLTVAPPQPVKVAPGELARYRLEVKIPEGVSTGFYIADYLPASMTFMNDNTTKVLFIDDGGLTSNVPAIAALPKLHVTTNKVNCLGPKPVEKLPPGQLSPTAFTPGVAPKFSLGTLTNSENDANGEYVIIEFNALVNNLPINVSALPNQDGVTLHNYFDVFIKGAPSPAATSKNADIQVVEPKLVVTKTASAANVLPGGVITFTIKVTNSGSTDAFEVLMTDPLPALSGLSFMPGTATVNSGCSSPTLNPSNGDVSVPRLPAACTVTETFQARVIAKCPTASVTNTAYATYSSLPGIGTPLGLSNQTGSITPGASGAVNGERVYKTSGSVTVKLICTGSLVVTKTITNLASVAPPAGTIFPVNVSCSPSGLNVNLSLTAGAPTQTVSNIPVGDTCTVTEGPLPAPIAHPVCASLGWGTPTYSPSGTVTIPTAGSTTTVLVKNTYVCNPSGNTSCAKPPAGMVAWWPLDETSGNTLHSIVGNHDGITSPGAIGAGGVSVATSPKVNSALFFGAAKATVPDDPALNFGAGDFSIDAWVRSQQSNLLAAVVDKLDVTGRRGYAFLVQNNRVQLVMANGVTSSTFQSSNTFVANGTWRHVAVTVRKVSGSPVGQFYIDGVPAGPTFTPLAGNINSNATLLIGSSRTSNSACSCEMSLDEIELFNTNVPAADIYAIFKADKNGKCRAKINGMKFNDLNGNGVKDSGEPGLPGWTIKATDSLGNVQIAITDSAGNYTLVVPAPASYTVSEGAQTGWIQSAPSGGTYSVAVTANQSINNGDFGNRKHPGDAKCDLQITKRVDPNPVVSGQPAYVNIVVTNVGTGPCHGPTYVSESMPSQMSLVSASVPSGSCNLTTGLCTYPPYIPAGGTVVFKYVFKVNAQPGTTFKNCASVKNAEDTNGANNQDCVELKTVGNSAAVETALPNKTRGVRRP